MQTGYGNEIWHLNCSMLIMRNRKRQITDGIEKKNQERIKMLRVKETYKNLEILEVVIIKQVEIKEKKCLRRTRKLLKSFAAVILSKLSPL